VNSRKKRLLAEVERVAEADKPETLKKRDALRVRAKITSQNWRSE